MHELEKKNMKNKWIENRPFDFTQKAVGMLLSITVYVSKLESQCDQMKTAMCSADLFQQKYWL